MEDPRDVHGPAGRFGEVLHPEREGRLHIRGPHGANKVEIRRAVEHVFNVKVTNVNTAQPARQAQAQPPAVDFRETAGHQAGLCDARGRPVNPVVRDQLRALMLVPANPPAPAGGSKPFRPSRN